MIQITILECIMFMPAINSVMVMLNEWLDRKDSPFHKIASWRLED